MTHRNEPHWPKKKEADGYFRQPKCAASWNLAVEFCKKAFASWQAKQNDSLEQWVKREGYAKQPKKEWNPSDGELEGMGGE